MKLKIDYVPTTSIKPYEKNARKHGDEDVDAIIASIQQFGFLDPIGVWHDTIVEGHGRLLAAIRLNMDSVPIIRLDELTDEERRAYALAHNRTAELSGWDFDLQAAELDDITNIDMSQFGFDLNQLDPNDFDHLFAPSEAKEKEEKQIQCPHCGEWFTP